MILSRVYFDYITNKWILKPTNFPINFTPYLHKSQQTHAFYHNNQPVPLDISSAKLFGCGMEPYKWWIDLFSSTTYFSIAENYTMTRKRCEAHCDTTYDRFGTTNIMVETSSFLFEYTSSLTFSRRGKTFLLKNEKQVKDLMQELFCGCVQNYHPMQTCISVIDPYPIFWGDVIHISMVRIHKDCAIISSVIF